MRDGNRALALARFEREREAIRTWPGWHAVADYLIGGYWDPGKRRSKKLCPLTLRSICEVESFNGYSDVEADGLDALADALGYCRLFPDLYFPDWKKYKFITRRPEIEELASTVEDLRRASRSVALGLTVGVLWTGPSRCDRELLTLSLDDIARIGVRGVLCRIRYQRVELYHNLAVAIRRATRPALTMCLGPTNRPRQRGEAQRDYSISCAFERLLRATKPGLVGAAGRLAVGMTWRGAILGGSTLGRLRLSELRYEDLSIEPRWRCRAALVDLLALLHAYASGGPTPETKWNLADTSCVLGLFAARWGSCKGVCHPLQLLNSACAFAARGAVPAASGDCLAALLPLVISPAELTVAIVGSGVSPRRQVSLARQLGITESAVSHVGRTAAFRLLSVLGELFSDFGWDSTVPDAITEAGQIASRIALWARRRRGDKFLSGRNGPELSN